VSADETCAVCGRTILAGERTHTYISPKEGPQLVCDLCREKAERRGWVDAAAAAADAGPGVYPPEERADVRERADPAAPGANVGRRVEPEAPEAPGMRLERAVARFNESEASHTVGGLMRSLGQPWVSIGAAAGSPSQVRITVAWELSWYQWAVDLDDEPGTVQQLDKGSEIDELEGPARQWNATAAPGGMLELGAPASGRAPDGEPVS
jgi:hypothetical protein